MAASSSSKSAGRYCFSLFNLSSDSEDSEVESYDIIPYETDAYVASKRRSSFLLKMNQMRKSQQLCDVNLKVEGETPIRAHRIVLSAASPFFRAMFTVDCDESHSETVELKDVEVDILKLIVEFAYTGEIVVDDRNVQSLLMVAHRYQMDTITKICCSFMLQHMSPANCLGIRALAKFLDFHDLYAAANKFADENFSKVVLNEEVLALPRADLCEYLERDSLVVVSEAEVFEGAVKWIKYDKKDRLQHRAQVLEKVRFPLISKDYLSSNVQEEEIIQDDCKCLKMVMDGMKYHLSDRQLFEGGELMNIRPRIKKHDFRITVIGSDDACQSLSLKTSNWTPLPAMPMQLRDYACVAVENAVYILGGSLLTGTIHTYCFNLVTQTYHQVACSLDGPRMHLAVCAYNGTLYASGGSARPVNSPCKNAKPLSKQVNCLDCQSGTWTGCPAMLARRWEHGMVVVEDCLYAMGGNSGPGNSAIQNTCEKLSFKTSPARWTEIEPMIFARRGHGVAVVEGLIYAIGGMTTDGKPLKTVECYDPCHDRWKPVASLPWKLHSVKCAVVSRSIYVVSGLLEIGRLTHVLELTPGNNSWAIHTRPLASRTSNVGACVADFGFVVNTE